MVVFCYLRSCECEVLHAAHFAIWKHYERQFVLPGLSPKPWNISVLLLKANAFVSAYFEGHRPIYLVNFNQGLHQSCSESLVSSVLLRTLTRFLLLIL